MRTVFWIVMFSMLLCGCGSGARPAALQSEPGACRRVVPPAQPAPADPRFGGPTPTPRPTAFPLPTCSPFPMPVILTPDPRAQSRRAAMRGATPPQNLTLSPASEHLDRIAVGEGVQAVTWRGDAGSILTLSTAFGYRSVRVADILGAGGAAAVAVSAGGRVHVLGGERYAYSDDLGLNWSVPVPAPGGRAPHLVVQPDGYALALFDSGGALMLSRQGPDGSWSSPETMAGGVAAYDAVRVHDGVVIGAATGSGVQVFRSGDHVAFLDAPASSVQLTARRGEVLIGMGDWQGGGGVAHVARSRDDGRTWSAPCLVQRSTNRIGDVVAFPTAQGPTVAVWSWWQPCGGGIVVGCTGAYPYIVLSTVRWVEGGGCVASPAEAEADAMSWEGGNFSGPPALLYTRTHQTHFRAAVGEGPESGFLAFEGEQLSTTRTDVYVAWFAPDGLLSGPLLGGASVPTAPGP